MQRDEQQSPKLDQLQIINLTNLIISKSIYKDLNVKLNPGGVCGGLASRYLLYKARGREAEFFEKLKIISRLANAKRAITEKEQATINSILKEILPLHTPELFKADVNQGDLAKIFITDGKSPIESGFEFAAFWNKRHFPKLLNDTIQEDEMVYLTGYNHAIAVFKKHDTYYVYDPNSEDGEVVFSDIHLLSDYITKAIFVPEGNDNFEIYIKTFRYHEKSEYKAKPNYPSKKELAEKLSSITDPEFANSLQACASVNDKELFKILLARGGNPLQQGTKGYDALHIATQYGASDVLKLILERQVIIPESQLISALRSAFTQNKKVPADMLIDYANIQYPGLIKKYLTTFLEDASVGGNIDLLHRIQAFDKSVAESIASAEIVFKAATEHGRTDVLRYYPNLQNISRDTFKQGLRSTITKGHSAAFNFLVDLVGPLEQDDFTLVIQQAPAKFLTKALMLRSVDRMTITSMQDVITAASVCNFAAIETLLFRRENQNQQQAELFRALKLACDGDPDQCKYLLNNINEKYFKENLLLTALVNGKNLLKAALIVNEVRIAESPHAGHQLALACQRGDLSIAKFLIEEGVSTNQRLEVEKEGVKTQQGLLQLAMSSATPELISLLLKHTKNLSSVTINDVVLHACWIGNVDILRAVSQYYPDTKINYDRLSIAIKYGRNNVIEYLIYNGTPVTRDLIIYLCKKGNTSLLEKLLERNIDDKYLLPNAELKIMLFDAATSGSAKTVECLCMLGPLQDSLDRALRLACEAGNANAVDVLLKHHARFKSSHYITHTHDGPPYRKLLYQAYGLITNGPEPLKDEDIEAQARIFKHEHVYRLLLEKNPTIRQNIDSIIEQETLTKKRKSEVVKEIQKGNFKLFKSGPTAIEKACKEGNLKAVKHNLELNNIDLATADPFGLTINLLTIAGTEHHNDILAYVLGKIDKSQKEFCLNMLLESGQITIVAAILELSKNYDISPNLKPKLLQHKVDIEKAFRLDLLRDGQTSQIVTDRQNDVRHNKNALGVLIHTEAQPPSPKRS